MKRSALPLAACALLLSACPSAPSEPPPPARKAEIPVAPPRALGALAAGTDAAPRPDVTLPGSEAEPDVPLLPPAPEDSAAPPEPEKPAAPAPAAPDAGIAL